MPFYNLTGNEVPGATAPDPENNIYKNQPGETANLLVGDAINPGIDANGNKLPERTYTGNNSTEGTDGSSGVDYQYALSVANTLYGFLPEAIVKKFAEGYAEYGGDKDLALSFTRQSSEYKKEFGWLFNDDGITLKMTEIEAIGVKESFKNTLREIGIEDFSDFEDEFNEMVGDVAPVEFQQRIDTVYAAINNRIPEVKTMLADYLGVEYDDATIFASLINPKIEDKVLNGAIDTITLGAEAASRGFSYSFGRFNELKQKGMDLKMAKELYENASGIIGMASTIGRDLDIRTLEDAALGDTAASKRVTRINAELASMQGINLGAAKKDGNIIGLTED